MTQQFYATVEWARGAAPFSDRRYSRAHAWHFDGGATVAASSSPLSVPPPLSDPAAVDPEEALVAAASSCHMLFFLSLCAARGWVVDRYRDAATGTLEADGAGRSALTRIVLRPQVRYAGPAPVPAERAAMHHEAHERCYVANSLRAAITVEEADV